MNCKKMAAMLALLCTLAYNSYAQTIIKWVNNNKATGAYSKSIAFILKYFQ